MPQHYLDPDQAEDPYSLPNIEVWQIEDEDEARDMAVTLTLRSDGYRELPDGSLTDPEPDPDLVPPVGSWFGWFCFPGCLPDSDPFGPYASEEEAVRELRDL